MAIDKKNFRKLLKKIGFDLTDTTGETWIKKYSSHNGYFIEINFENEIIEYMPSFVSNKIEVKNKTTCNFSQS